MPKKHVEIPFCRIFTHTHFSAYSTFFQRSNRFYSTLVMSRRKKVEPLSGKRHYHDNKPRSQVCPSHWQNSRRLSPLVVRNRTSLAQGLVKSGHSYPPRRFAEINSLLLLTKLAAASSVVYLTFRWWLHHPWMQRRAIARMFAAKTDILIDTAVPKLERKSEEAFLKRWFNSPPNGPIVLAGPVGAGRSYLIKSVLSDRKMTIYVDYRAQPVVSGEEHIAGFVAAAGYVIPQATEIMRMFTREEQRKTKITPQEADRALAVILQALQDCKASKWYDGVPLICLDDFSVTGVRSPSGALELDPFWQKFLDWCVYVSDAKLAHVVFVPAHSFEPHHVLYDHPIFRTKRVLLFVDYPSLDKVRHYVKNFVVDYCTYGENGNGKVLGLEAGNSNQPLDPYLNEPYLNHMVGWITNCLGGQLDDLMHILGGLRRGDKYGAVLRRMITDAVSTLEERLEFVLSEAHNPTTSKEEVYKKYLRLWSAMEMLRDNEVVNRRDIVRHVFKEHTVELKQYVEWGIFAYANQKAEIDDGAGESSNRLSAVSSVNTAAQADSPAAQPASTPASSLAANASNAATTSTTQTGAQTSGSQTTSTDEKSTPSGVPTVKPSPYPVWWKADSVTSPPKVPETAATAAPSNPSPTADGASSSSSSGSGAAYVSPTTRRTHSTLLNASLESMLISAGSPRLRIAFDLLLKDERLSDRKEAMTIHLSVKSTQDRLDKIEVTRKQRLEELQVNLSETNRLLTLLNVWKEEFGLEFVESRKKRLMNQETEIYKHLDALQRETERLMEQKTELEARTKQLTVRL